MQQVCSPVCPSVKEFSTRGTIYWAISSGWHLCIKGKENTCFKASFNLFPSVPNIWPLLDSVYQGVAEIWQKRERKVHPILRVAWKLLFSKCYFTPSIPRWCISSEAIFLCGTVFLLCCCILIFRLLMGSGILEPLKWQHRDKQSLRWVINKRENTSLHVWRRRDAGTVMAQILHILTRVNILHRRDDKMQNQPQRSQPTLLRCFLITVFIKKQKRHVPMVLY